MDTKEILKFCANKGLLIEPELLKLFKETTDIEGAKIILENIKNHTSSKIITRSLFEENRNQVSEFFLELPKENQEKLERFKVKLGLQIEILRETSKKEEANSELDSLVIVNSRLSNVKKKINVDDFVKNLRGRFQSIREILQERAELENLVSINKLSKTRQGVSIIGLISSKIVTKNNNLLFDVEDLTGRVRVLINQNKPDLYKIAEDISMDSVIGFSGFGDREIFFENKIIFPDVALFEKKQSPIEECAVFISDLQFGSKLFLKGQFNKFIEYLSEKNTSEEARKIKYLFIVGDLVSGVGVYPLQIKDLEIGDIEEQYNQLAELLKKIRKDIKIIISPGNHDGVRLMEPQPILDEKYAWALYNLTNVVMTGNPAYVNIGARNGFSGIDVLTYHGFSYPYYANNVPCLIEKGMNSPEDIMAYLLKNRHLAPTHTSVQYLPSETDNHVIKKIPDIFASGHLHKLAISKYNGVLILSNSTWENETEYQKKGGSKPDFCKVPLVNLKTRAVKILDFE